MPAEPIDQMDASQDVLAELRKDFPPEDLPGPGDLKDAIEAAGYELVRAT